MKSFSNLLASQGTENVISTIEQLNHTVCKSTNTFSIIILKLLRVKPSPP